MWMKINDADIIKKGNISYVVVDYRKEEELDETKTYGDIDIQEELSKVKILYQNNFPDFDFRLPNKDELLVVNVKERYGGICVIRSNGKENLYPNCEGMIDHWVTWENGDYTLNDRIILVYPPPYRKPIEILHHEIGHWFFDRIGDKMAKQYGLKDRRNIIVAENNIEIASFDNSTEMAALYCEEYFNGKKPRENNSQESLLRKVDEITKNSGFPLTKIKTELDEKYKAHQ